MSTDPLPPDEDPSTLEESPFHEKPPHKDVDEIDFGPEAPGEYVPPLTLVLSEHQTGADLPKARFVVETWDEFSAKAGEHVPVLVEGLWPENALGFIAAPPKKGKTWVALALAISVATGRPYLGRFRVPEPRHVLYVALEGHRAAIRSRIGAISHGLGLNPEPGGDLARLHFSYKPRGINISDPEWALALQTAAADDGCALIVIDVLRAAARLKENSNDEFVILRKNLEPALEDHSIALLHHFGKLTEMTKERSPGERMSGGGAMYGAMDVGVFITGSENGAKNLRIEIESRDIATPERLGVHLRGEGTGEHGGWTYNDRLTIDCDDDTPEERDVKASAEEIRDYIIEQGGSVEAKQIRVWFEISEPTLTRRLGRLMQLGIDYVGGRGKPGRLEVRQVPTYEDPTRVGTLELTNFPAQQSQTEPSSDKFPHDPHVGTKTAQQSQKPSSKVPTSLRDSSAPVGTRDPGNGTEPQPDDDIPF